MSPSAPTNSSTVAAAHRVAADTAGVTVDTTADGTCGLDADPVRMRQALGNLVSKALRHTPADGTVTLAAEELPYVFDRFWRADKSRSRRTGGSGIGLPIVRHLVAAHGGTADAASEPGAGAVFTLRLPAGAAPTETGRLRPLIRRAAEAPFARSRSCRPRSR